ncbi:MAG: serine--tRNA ligase, partial [Candidatus Verstraetearchaeota archaeon]|nr:serine--tRNA ligase [Candidatus Verstraetearchaeota archaeon]
EGLQEVGGFMLDIKVIREDPVSVRNNLARRNDPKILELFDELIELDKEWRKAFNEVGNLRGKRNRITEEIARMKKQGLDVSERIREAEQIPAEIKSLESKMETHRTKMDQILMRLPNMMDDSVPYGRDESENVVVRTWGEPRKFDFVPKDHIDLATSLDLVDLERGAKVAGARFYYLKNDLVRLNYALIRYGLDFLVGRGFTPFQPPYMMKKEVLAGAVSLSDFEDTIYKIEGEDLYLIATSEHALLGLHAGEILEGRKLPLRYCGVSPCFRKEAGAHGRDTKGIFRVHQFEKVEQFVFSRPEDSTAEHELLIRNAEEFFQSLGLPYRVVNVCSGDLGTVAAKKYDLEAWLPGQGKYREEVSCSNCTSYQAVRANIRYRDRPNEPTKYVHTLNSTLVATERALVAILENYQNPDGSVEVPTVLIPYMQGKEKLEPRV